MCKKWDLYGGGNITFTKRVDTHYDVNLAPTQRIWTVATPTQQVTRCPFWKKSDPVQKDTLSIILEMWPPSKGQDVHVGGARTPPTTLSCEANPCVNQCQTLNVESIITPVSCLWHTYPKLGHFFQHIYSQCHEITRATEGPRIRCKAV